MINEFGRTVNMCHSVFLVYCWCKSFKHLYRPQTLMIWTSTNFYYQFLLISKLGSKSPALRHDSHKYQLFHVFEVSFLCLHLIIPSVTRTSPRILDWKWNWKFSKAYMKEIHQTATLSSVNDSKNSATCKAGIKIAQSVILYNQLRCNIELLEL